MHTYSVAELFLGITIMLAFKYYFKKTIKVKSKQNNVYFPNELPVVRYLLSHPKLAMLASILVHMLLVCIYCGRHANC